MASFMKGEWGHSGKEEEGIFSLLKKSDVKGKQNYKARVKLLLSS